MTSKTPCAKALSFMSKGFAKPASRCLLLPPQLRMSKSLPEPAAEGAKIGVTHARSTRSLREPVGDSYACQQTTPDPVGRPHRQRKVVKRGEITRSLAARDPR